MWRGIISQTINSLTVIAPTWVALLALSIPFRIAANQSSPPGTLPWPAKISDIAISQQPIISDLAEGNSTNITSVPKTEAHFSNGGLSSINAGYADGQA